MLSPELKRINDTYVMAFVLWREARREPREGLVAIGHVILNRVARPKWWGTSIDTVVYKPWQFSSMTDPNDPQLIRYPIIGRENWDLCLEVADDVLSGRTVNPVPTADSYYAISMDKAGNPPKWSKTNRFIRQVGDHKFYDTDGEHPDNRRVA